MRELHKFRIQKMSKNARGKNCTLTLKKENQRISLLFLPNLSKSAKYRSMKRWYDVDSDGCILSSTHHVLYHDFQQTRKRKEEKK